MLEIKEMMNDNEPYTNFRGRDRTNSDNWADNVIQQVQSDIKQELNKPSNQHVTSFTENMVYTHRREFQIVVMFRKGLRF